MVIRVGEHSDSALPSRSRVPDVSVLVATCAVIRLIRSYPITRLQVHVANRLESFEGMSPPMFAERLA